MYHGTPERVEKRFDVSAGAFAAQLQLIRELGRGGTTLEAAAADSSGMSVAITFDDAELSNYGTALPALQQAGMQGTFLVVTEWVGTTGFCSWSQLREMADAGMSIQSHTASHPFLSTLSREQVHRELADSRQELEQRLGRPVQTLALPNGDQPSRACRDLLFEAGYRVVANSRWGANPVRPPATDRITWCTRFTVRAGTPAARVQRMITGAESAWSAEGIRLGALSQLRDRLGVARYNRIRRAVLAVPNILRRD